MTAVAGVSPAQAAAPSAKAALGLEPVQSGVVYERVSGDQVEQCRVVDLEINDWSGWEVVDGDGSTLRRFADTNGDKKVDLWCYFQYGVEVYRDVDADFNGKADQYRWLGTGGTRWGLDEDEDGILDRWKQISAEEVAAEVVATLSAPAKIRQRAAQEPEKVTPEVAAALNEKNAERFARLLATESELAGAGLSSQRASELAESAARAAKDFAALAKQQKAVDADAKWLQFAAPAPGVVPAGTDGTTKDLLVYENAVAMFEQESGSGQVLVGTIIHVDGAWRLVDLPSVVDEGQPMAQSSGTFFTPGGGPSPEETSMASRDGAAQELVSQLESIDSKLAAASEPEEQARWHAQRADVVEKLIEAAEGPQQRDMWVRQLVDTVSVAVQSGVYREGLERLDQIASKYAQDNKALSAYAEFQAIGTEYTVRQSPDADFAKVQEWYLEQLTDFVKRYPEQPEAAQAMLQLALSKEFEDKEDEALEYYQQVAESFSGTDAGKKAAGAVRRLNSVGQTIDLQGTTIDGRSFQLSSLRGAPVVLHYWATWCEPCKQEMKVLRRLQARFQQADLQLVGINIDRTRKMAADYLKENPLPWTQLFEQGGLEASPLANAFGVQTLPTMMLIDSDGKVVRHNVNVNELETELDQLLK